MHHSQAKLHYYCFYILVILFLFCMPASFFFLITASSCIIFIQIIPPFLINSTIIESLYVFAWLATGGGCTCVCVSVCPPCAASPVIKVGWGPDWQYEMFRDGRDRKQSGTVSDEFLLMMLQWDGLLNKPQYLLQYLTNWKIKNWSFWFFFCWMCIKNYIQQKLKCSSWCLRLVHTSTVMDTERLRVIKCLAGIACLQEM